MLSHYRLVITDRYHGAIFSQIVSTPTIVLSSADHKLSSGVKWFPKEQFTNYIAYANDLDEAYQLAICFCGREKSLLMRASILMKTIGISCTV